MKSGPGDAPKAVANTLTLDPIKDKELFDKAERILTHCGVYRNTGPITKLEKTRDGFYRAHYTIYGSNNETSLLDLDFPFAQEDFETLLRRIETKKDIQIFLSLGAGQFDYPKKENEDPQEANRAFFVVDKAYGFVEDTEVKKERPLLELDWYITSRNVRSEKPERTYFYNGLPYDAAKNSFDIVQMINLLSEPKGSIFQEHRAGEIYGYVKLIKPITGELFIFNANTPDAYPLRQVKKEVEKLGGSIEILIDLSDGGLITDQQLVQRLRQHYHVNPIHFEDPLTDGPQEMDAGTYAVIIRKPKESE
ncbi:hypothetical protein HYW59_00475 [Candidatus Kaiserbacteria bacterium]|nr:hypothetical protein [Candidatus Kaiserbacteria bacterium]